MNAASRARENSLKSEESTPSPRSAISRSLTRAKRDKGGHCASVREISPDRMRVRCGVYIYIYMFHVVYAALSRAIRAYRRMTRHPELT